jgi:hypothetical protein
MGVRGWIAGVEQSVVGGDRGQGSGVGGQCRSHRPGSAAVGLLGGVGLVGAALGGFTGFDGDRVGRQRSDLERGRRSGDDVVDFHDPMEQQDPDQLAGALGVAAGAAGTSSGSDRT